ncbi:hypothetical protein MPC4_50056 [Methylocella tundrae]|uniref:Uncharacterized protein n=1 Tax=Methylocella tundrae TaxID=227605 RepID=A0A8B6MCC2_METTU|nr:hypothetical protein MPC4_50056 [Methylocella tundrae]
MDFVTDFLWQSPHRITLRFPVGCVGLLPQSNDLVSGTSFTANLQGAGDHLKLLGQVAECFVLWSNVSYYYA